MTLSQAKHVIRTARYESQEHPTVPAIVREVVARLEANCEPIDSDEARKLVLEWCNRE